MWLVELVLELELWRKFTKVLGWGLLPLATVNPQGESVSRWILLADG